MVRFGEQLQTEEIPEWKREYMDYEMLKEQIDDLVRLKDEPKARAAFDAKRNIFQGLLDDQISKVLAIRLPTACKDTLSHAASSQQSHPIYE